MTSFPYRSVLLGFPGILFASDRPHMAGTHLCILLLLLLLLLLQDSGVSAFAAERQF